MSASCTLATKEELRQLLDGAAAAAAAAADALAAKSANAAAEAKALAAVQAAWMANVGGRWRDYCSAANPSTFSMCINGDGQIASAKGQSREL